MSVVTSLSGRLLLNSPSPTPSTSTSMTWSEVHEPGGFSVRPRAVMPGEGRARHQQVGGDLATLDVAQRMRETLGQHLHSGLGDVVGGVARRAGNPLL